MQQITEDRRSLIGLMSRLGIRRDPLKQAVGWSLEKAGRLKLNGRLTEYSPLSRLVEMEGLWTGVNGKLSLWRALMAVADEDPRLDALWLIELEARAHEQLRRIDKHRNSAARDAFSGGQRSEVSPGPSPGSSSPASGSATTSVESSSSGLAVDAGAALLGLALELVQPGDALAALVLGVLDQVLLRDLEALGFALAGLLQWSPGLFL